MEIKAIPNQIIKQPLEHLNLTKVDSIALHHMANATADVKEVERWHIAKGWRAIGYNFWVGFDGTVYRGRGFNLGAGVENQNGHIISIGFQGDYDKEPTAMPDAQFNAGLDIIKYIKDNIPNAQNVAGHKDFMATACPGKYFPLAEMQAGKKRGEKVMITDVNEAINKLVDKGVINSPDYWTSAYQVVNNLDKLLINMANALS